MRSFVSVMTLVLTLMVATPHAWSLEPSPSKRIAVAKTERTAGTAEWGFFSIRSVGDPLEDLPHVDWSRMTGMFWDKLETPPGSGNYQWKYMDELVSRAMKGGYNLVFVLKTGNNKKLSETQCFAAATASKDKEKYLHSCPFSKQYAEKWQRLVSAIVERYDGDGKGDMPGLSKSFRLAIQIENEAGDPFYWYLNEKADGRKAAAAYLKLLKISYEAVKKADPNTEVILAGLIHPNYLARCDEKSSLKECSATFHERNRAFTIEILKHPEIFDAVDVHFFNYFRFDPAFIPDSIAWIKKQMRDNGYKKPIYSLEWTGAMMMMVKIGGHQKEFLAHFPYRKDFENRKELQNVYKNLSDPKYGTYRNWFDAEQAREFPKLFTTMLAHGITLNIHVQFRDFVGRGWDNVWWNWQGIVRYEGTRRKPVLIRKPSYFAFEQLSKRLYGFASAEILQGGRDVYAYKFTFTDRKPVYVLWTEGKPRKLDISKHTRAEHVRLVHIVTELKSDNRPRLQPDETVPTTAVPVSDTPIFLEATGT